MPVDNLRLSILLVLCAVLAYSGVLGLDYVNYDDVNYVVDNQLVTDFRFQDLTEWFKPQFGNFTPLAWLSYILTVQLFGTMATGHHAVNLMLHVGNSVLLYLLILNLGKNRYLVFSPPIPAFLTALLFALHPQNVEAVAWIAARKDLLMTFFLLLSVNYYSHAVTNRKSSDFYLAFLFFNLACLAKPTAVSSLPVFMVMGLSVVSLSINSVFAMLKRLGPYVLTVLVYVAISWAYQDMASALSYEKHGVSDRAAIVINNITAYYQRYYCLGPYIALYQTDMEVDSLSWLLTGLMFLVAVSMPLFRQYLLLMFGILSMLLLLPGVGLVQVGVQGGADRFAYMPFIPLHMMNVFAAWKLYKIASARYAMVFTLVGMTLYLSLLYVTYQQAGVWKNRESLWTHAVDAVPENVSTRIQLGYVYYDSGRYDMCRQQFELAFNSIRGKMYIDADGLMLGNAMCHYHTGDIDKARGFLRYLQEKPIVREAVKIKMLEYLDKISRHKEDSLPET